ncbi:hypothetical protein BV898_04846 [Hypsibius exemplaris]|uniref:Uncharacterized protein n=1 Tax=Hypsibius exemplaris TaxID=2072580 RepID=A0A1W0X1B5_HYPEX|nr:hypothetical protein BV898_04846 [Hypsibius exemplaris]
MAQPGAFTRPCSRGRRTIWRNYGGFTTLEATSLLPWKSPAQGTAATRRTFLAAAKIDISRETFTVPDAGCESGSRTLVVNHPYSEGPSLRAEQACSSGLFFRGYMFPEEEDTAVEFTGDRDQNDCMALKTVKNLSREIGRRISGCLNAEDGTILMGIHDSCVIRGFVVPPKGFDKSQTVLHRTHLASGAVLNGRHQVRIPLRQDV